MQESDILFQSGNFWVSSSKFANVKWKGFVVWEDGITCSKLVASIGFEGVKGLERAKTEAIRRSK